MKARALIREIGEVFDDEVKRRRGDKLSAAADVASGEVWLGPDAKRLGLIDEIGTSDDFLLKAAESADIYRLAWKRPRRIVERILQGAEGLLYR